MISGNRNANGFSVFARNGIPTSGYHVILSENYMDPNLPPGQTPSKTGLEYSGEKILISNNYCYRMLFGLIINKGSRDMTVRNNVFIGSGENTSLILAKSHKDKYLHNITIVNNYFQPNSKKGIVIEDSIEVKNLIIKNNIFYNPDSIIAGRLIDNQSTIPASADISYNLLYNFSQNDMIEFQHDNLLNVEPGLSFTGTIPFPFYSPKNNSSRVVDVGVDIGLPFSGKAPDIGPYEFGSITTGIQKNVLNTSTQAQSDSRKMTRLFNLLGRTYSGDNSVK